MPLLDPSSASAFLPMVGTSLFLLATMALFAARCMVLGRPRTPYVEARTTPAIWKWWMEWWIWLWGPVERACLALGITPNVITITSTALTGLSAGIVGAGYLSLGGWVYLFASSLDLVDGRVARAQGSATKAGAFLDSTLDRVAELMFFAGLAVHFRNTPTLYAALAAAGFSVVVSYARARGEGLGETSASREGSMQRAERVVLTGLPCALAPLFDALYGTGAGEWVAGSALAVLAVVASLTALRRGYGIWRALKSAQAPAQPVANVRWIEHVRRKRLGR